MKDDEPHDVGQFQAGDGRCLCKTAGGGRGRQVTAENSRDGRTTQRPPSWSLSFACRANPGNDWTGQHNVVRPGPGPGRTDCPVENTISRG